VSEPAARFVVTLGGAGALAGVAIVAAFLWTEPRIEANRARALRAAIEEVLKQPDRYDTVYVVDGGRARKTTLELGHQAGREAEVLSGLSEGDRVIEHPSDTITDGARIQERVQN